MYKIMGMPVGYQNRDRLSHISPFVKMATNKSPNTEWDFKGMIIDKIPSEFIDTLAYYLRDLDNYVNDPRYGELVGWKMTESNLIYPWLVRLYPEWYYVHIVRDVRDLLTREEYTDTESHTNLFNVRGYKSYPQKNKMPRRPIIQAINWKYQLDIVKSIQAPNYIRVTLEDLVMSQDEELKRLSEFLGFELKKIHAEEEVVESWKGRDGKVRENWEEFSFLDDYMEELKYSDWPLLGDNKEYRRK
jgi:hypothetical protein